MANEVTISGTPLNPYLSDILEKTGRATVIGNVPEGGIYNIVSLKTGTYAPVFEYYDVTEDGVLPDTDDMPKGWRIVTKEKERPFGKLYTYSEVSQIKKALVDTGSKWRIPTKEDWDKMLNSIEPETGENHNSLGEGYFGEVAGSLLKSTDNLWEDSSSNKDEYGFAALPLGYADYRTILMNGRDKDKNKDVEGFRKCAAFWTDTKVMKNSSSSPLFGKYLWYGSDKVMQQSAAAQSRMSLRLVKDFEAGFDVYEPILGNYYPCGMIYSGDFNDHNASVWTLSNIGTSLNGSDFGYVSKEWEGYDESKICYYINEWTGDRWLRHKMNEGDSVVILHEGDTYNHEWRIYIQDNEQVLVDCTEAISDEAIAAVKDKLEVIVEEKMEPYESRISANEKGIKDLSASTEDRYNELKKDILDCKIYTDDSIKILSEKIDGLSSVTIDQENTIQEVSTAVSENSEKILKVISDVDKLRDDVIDNEKTTAVALNDLDLRIKNLSGYTKDNISDINEKIDTFSGSVIDALSLIDDENSDIVFSIGELSDNLRLSYAVISANTSLIKELSAGTESSILSLSDNISDINSRLSTETEERKSEDAAIREETDKSISALEDRFKDYLSGATVSQEEIDKIKSDILAEVTKMIAGSSVPLFVTETQYNNMVDEGTILEDALYYVYEDEEIPVTPEESGTTGEINTDTGVLTLANATVTEDVLIIDGGSIVDGVLTFGESSSTEGETTPTEVSDDGTATISNSEVDEITGTLSLNNGSVDENGVLTL